MDDSAQSALFDAFLFFVIALVASATVLAYASLMVAEAEGTARAEALAYAEDVRSALMLTTLEDPWYVNGSGDRVELGQGITVERFLLDEIQLLGRGLNVEDFSVMNSMILDRAGSLVRPPFIVGISASLSSVGDDTNLWLGEPDGPLPDRFTAPWTYEAADGGDVVIAVHLWYA